MPKFFTCDTVKVLIDNMRFSSLTYLDKWHCRRQCSVEGSALRNNVRKPFNNWHSKRSPSRSESDNTSKFPFIDPIIIVISGVFLIARRLVAFRTYIWPLTPTHTPPSKTNSRFLILWVPVIFLSVLELRRFIAVYLCVSCKRTSIGPVTMA